MSGAIFEPARELAVRSSIGSPRMPSWPKRLVDARQRLA
jgi:hypothetical protein